MSLEEDLKKVIGPRKEDIEMLEAAKRRPPPSPEKIEAQLRASGAFRGTAKGKSDATGKQDRQGD